MSRAQDAFDHEVRIEKMVDLASMWASAHDLMRGPPEPLLEVIEDVQDDKKAHPSMVGFKKAMGMIEDGAGLLDRLQELSLSEVNVIFVQGATCCRVYHGPGSFSSSWGCMYTRWVAAETVDAAWAMLVEWARGMHELDKKNDLKKLKGKKS